MMNGSRIASWCIVATLLAFSIVAGLKNAASLQQGPPNGQQGKPAGESKGLLAGRSNDKTLGGPPVKAPGEVKGSPQGNSNVNSQGPPQGSPQGDAKKKPKQ